MKKRNTYIDNIDLNVAQETYKERIQLAFETLVIPVEETLGRVTAEAVYATYSSPYYNASAMDGIAVIVESTYGATDMKPIILTEGKDYTYVNTGNVIEPPYNGVIMIEDVKALEDGRVKIIAGAYPWQHVRPIGEDIVTGEMILPSYHQVRAIDLGALFAGGVQEVKVVKMPQIGILPTGTEIVDHKTTMDVGRIVDSNSAMFEGMVIEYGGIANKYAPVKDDYNLLKEAVKRGVEENDLLIVNAGSSAGTKDYTKDLIEELGEVVVHGIAIKPGKPTILGIIDGKPVIGLPGYPVSAYIAFEAFVKPLIYQLTGLPDEPLETLQVKMATRVVSSFKHQERVRVRIGYMNGAFMAIPVDRGAGTTMSLVRADGIITIPKNCEGFELGEVTEATLMKPLNQIKRTLVSIGSHDMLMDLISDQMPLSSSHKGSMGGIMAMRRHECHLAPIHLLDEDSGDYNVSYVKKYFNGQKMAIIKGVRRLQGLMVQKGNPKGIVSIKDMTLEGMTYANRQNGAGTRVLLDYLLKREGVEPCQISGYEKSLNTHMAVAIAVKSGTVDAGMGIYAAAQALDIDFVEVGFEDYDFLVREEDLALPKIKQFIHILMSKEFADQLHQIGGYELVETGKIVLVGD